MKKFSLIFLVLLGLFSCSPDEDEITDDQNTPTNDVTCEIDIPGAIYSDIVLDDNDNIYFLGDLDSGAYLFAYDKDGHEKWKSPVVPLTFSESHLLFAENKIIVGVKEQVYGFDLNGTELWNVTNQTECLDLAYSNGHVYSVGLDLINDRAVLTSINISGVKEWDKIYSSFYAFPNAYVSAKDNKVCLVLENIDSNINPSQVEMHMIDNAGTTGVEVWGKAFPESVYNPSVNRASFDANNVYFEEAVDGDTYIHSYNISNGGENWTVKLSDMDSMDSIILTGGGKVVATYRSNIDAGGVDSFKVLDANSGNVLTNKEKVISGGYQLLLTANNTILTTYVGEDHYTLKEFSMQGDVLQEILDTDYLIRTAASSFFVLNSSGKFITPFSDGYVICSQAYGFRMGGSGTWNSIYGNVYGTHSLNE